MPNLLAHSLLVKRLYIQEEENRTTTDGSFLEGNYSFLSLGAQGPDPLFYFGVVPFHAPHFVTAKAKLGNKIHASDGKAYFSALLRQCYNNDIPKTLSRLRAFVFGQFAHYLLDRECHPYILYRSGFDKDGRISGIYHYRHTSLESAIDVALAKKYRMTYFLSHPSEVLCSEKDFLTLLNVSYVQVLRQCFPEVGIPGKIYSEAVNNMRSTIRFMNNHPSFKAKLVGKNALGALALRPDDRGDVLNESHETWTDPVTGESHNESFLDLHTRAFQLLSSLYDDIRRKGFAYDVFARYIDGRDFYGRPIGSRWTFRKDD